MYSREVNTLDTDTHLTCVGPREARIAGACTVYDGGVGTAAVEPVAHRNIGRPTHTGAAFKKGIEAA